MPRIRWSPGNRKSPEVTSALYPLHALVCGFEKSGTTLINEILRRHPRLDSGFEGGFLLADSPREFRHCQPYFAFFKKTWDLTREDVRYICDTDDWGECYRRARERSPVIVDKRSLIFDKTPIYMKHLAPVLDKVPGLPCVVNVRDPRSLFLSWANWSGFRDDPEAWLEANFDDNVQRFLDYARGYEGAVERHSARLLLNRFEILCQEPERVFSELFDFFGLDFSPEYLAFSSQHFVYGNQVSLEYLYPYRGQLSEQLCQRILDATAAFSQWHYHD